VYQFAVPLFAPVLDVLLVAALVRGQAGPTAASYAAFFAVDAGLSLLAIRLERERLSLAWELPLQRIAHRYLLWLALVRSLWAAAVGLAVGWGKLARTGTVQPALAPVRGLRK
jgi:hypothetical protein